MKKNLLLIVAAVFAIMLTSCNKGGEVEYLPFKDAEHNNYGLIGVDGKALYANEFKSMPTAVMHDRFWVKNDDGKWDLYSASKNKPEKIAGGFAQAGVFIEDVAPVVAPGKPIQFIDKDGNVKVTLGNVDGKPITDCTNFSDGLAIIKAGDLYGAVNAKGEVIIQPEYSEINPASDGKVVAVAKDQADVSDSKERQYTILSTKGEVIGKIKLGGDESRQFVDGVIVASEESSDGTDMIGLKNEKDEWVLKATSNIKAITQIHDGTFIYSDGEKYGLMDFKGKDIISPKYDALYYAKSGSLLYAKNDGEDNFYLMNDKEEKQGTEEFMTALEFHGSYAAVQTSENNWDFIDDRGKARDLNTSVYDIYHDDSVMGDLSFQSQYMDANALVEQMHLTKYGMLGLNINSTAQTLVPALSRLTNNDINGSPDYYNSYSTEVSGSLPITNISASIHVSFNADITMSNGDYYSPSLVFTSAIPTQFRIEIDNSGLMKGNMSKAVASLIKKVKSFGTVYKENDNAIIVKVDDKYSYFVVNGGDEIDVVFGMLDLNSIDISMYANVKDDTSVDINYSTTEDAIDVDSAVVDSVY